MKTNQRILNEDYPHHEAIYAMLYASHLLTVGDAVLGVRTSQSIPSFL